MSEKKPKVLLFDIGGVCNNDNSAPLQEHVYTIA
ncbi:hypothetical protein M7I_4051 [Glarea lozoyensis 74030]|uniref:Uncharacterized protein n=1 Tax=Glarea lozoyensis (strain ATCC 74030 / MF5533) TaxID=1104152 RepID=H0EN48_GLAL7|nr:hypothetical protein M7I_4051 [Glarea lozoyensis 74030]